MVIFDRFSVPSNDKGDFYTANEHDESSYNDGMPLLADKTIRAADTLDFRPRVAPFASVNSSPFDYTSRDFAASGNTTVVVVTPNESMVLGYQYYVGRKDRIIVTPSNKYKVVEGAPAKYPALPSSKSRYGTCSDSYPPYLYNVNDAQIELIDNRRYTMRDIGALEDRVETLKK